MQRSRVCVARLVDLWGRVSYWFHKWIDRARGRATLRVLREARGLGGDRLNQQLAATRSSRATSRQLRTSRHPSIYCGYNAKGEQARRHETYVAL